MIRYFVSVMVIYAILLVLFFVSFGMTWFIELEMPSLNVLEWSKSGRTLLSMYIVFVPIGVAGSYIWKESKK